MSDNVIRLPVRQQQSTAPLTWTGFTCEMCGGAWIRVAVMLDSDGRIVGNGLSGRCVDCNIELHLPVPPEVSDTDRNENDSATPPTTESSP